MPNLENLVEFAENPDPRCACVLLLDTSGSMSGEKIRQLNEGLVVLRDSLLGDDLAKRRVEIAIVTFDSEVQVKQDFVTAENFVPPTLTAQGLTQMGTGIIRAVEMVQERKSMYKQAGIVYYRPWIFMITDGRPEGEPADVMARACALVQDDEAKKRYLFWSVGVEAADMDILSQISKRAAPVKLEGLNFRDLFEWLSKSTTEVSHSKVDEMVALPSPSGWTKV